MAKDLKYCIEFVRRYDYEGYLGGFVYPKNKRPVYFALRALNAEFATVSDRARDSQLASLRFQWWKERLEKCWAKSDISGTSPEENPILNLLIPYSKDLSLTLVKRLATSRDRMLTRNSFASLEEMEEYGQSSTSTLLSLQAQILGQDPLKVDPVHEFCEHIGKALVIVNFIRSATILAAQRRCYLPADILARQGLSTQSVFKVLLSNDASNLEKFCDAVFEIATRANDRMISAAAVQRQVPVSLLPAFSQAIPLQQYLKRLQSANFDLRQRKAKSLPWYLPLLYLFHYDIQHQVI